ncbi:MAG: hypothetical protein ACAI44_25550, partial [Candidatus Sericytochromatia bacterium]
ALRKSPDNARLHVALGYLSLLLDDETQARIYLKKALRLEPELLQAYELKLCLENPDVLLQRARHSLEKLETIPPDYDTLYEGVQLLVLTTIRQLALKRQDPQPALSEDEMTILQSETDDLLDLQQRILRQFEGVEKEFDTHELRARLEPLETLIRRYQQALETSRVFSEMLAEITRLRTRARLLMQHFKMLRESDLDIFYGILDACEKLADRLDGLNARQVDISPVEPVYLDLIAFVGQLQDLFDEA